MLPKQAGYPVCFNVQCAMYNVQCAMYNDYFLRERRVTVTQLHTPHSTLHTVYVLFVWLMSGKITASLRIRFVSTGTLYDAYV